MAFDGTLKFDTKIDQTGFKSGLDGLGSLAKSGLTGIGDVAKTGIAAVTAAITAASGAVVGLGAKAIATGKEFEAGMSQVQATLGISVYDLQNNIDGAVDTMQLLTDKAEEMGATTQYTAKQAADGLNILAMSGYDAAQAVNMIDSTLSLAAAGGLQLGNAAQYISGSMKGFTDESSRFKDEAEAATYYADMIAKGATLAATNVDQLGAAMSGAAAIASSYGQTSQTTEVSLLRLAEQGEVGSNAATMLSAAMKNIYTPMDQAKNAMDQLGVKAYDETGKMRDFNTVVDELHTALSKYSPEEASKLEDAIFGIQGKEAFDKMVVSTQDKVQGFYDSLAYTEDGAMGSAAAQAEAMMDNLEGDITYLESAVDGLYNTLYKSMNGTLRELVQLGNGYVTALTDTFKTKGFDGAAEKLGSILSDALDHIGDYLPDVVGIGGSIVSSLLDGISENSGSIIETGLDMGLKMLSGFGDITVNFLDLGANLAASLASGIETKLPQISGTSREILLRITKAVGDNLPVMLESGADIVEMLAGALTNDLPRLTVFGNQTVRQIAEAIRNSLPDILQAGTGLIGAFGTSILDSLPVLLDCAVQIMDTLVGVISDPQDLSALIGAATQIVTTLGGALLGNLQPLLNAGATLVNALVSALAEPDALTGLLDAGLSIITGLADVIAVNADPLAGAAAQIVMVLGNALLSNLPTLLEAGLEVIRRLMETFSAPDAMTELLDAGLNLITSFAGILTENLSPILGAVIAIIGAMGAWLGEHALDLVGAGLVIVQAVVDAVIQNLPLLLDAAVQIVEGLCKGIEEDSDDVLIAVEQIIRTLLDFLLAPDTMKKIGETGGKVIRALIPAAKELAGDLLGFAYDFFTEYGEALLNPDWSEIGKNIVEGILSGILGVDFDSELFKSDFAENWISGFKDIFGIHSPSTVMRDQIGKNLALGLTEGFSENIGDAAANAFDAMTNIPAIPLQFEEPEMDDNISVNLAAEAAGVLAALRQPQTAAIADPAVLDLMLNAPPITASSMIEPSPTASVTNNYTTTNTTSTASYSSTDSAPSGDIIIPVSIGGQQLETFVITAAQLANARSGGGTI